MSAAHTSHHLARAKSSADLLDRIKQEKSKLEEQLATEYINKTLEMSIPLDQLQKELKDGVILCK